MGSLGARIAAVHLRSLPVECQFGELPGPNGADPALHRSRPCAVRAEVRGRSVLIDVSPPARAAGVRPGMTESEARARLTALEVRPRELTRELERLRRAGELLLAFGPNVEVCSPGFLFVEVGRSRGALSRRLKGDTSERAVAEAITRVMSRAGHDVTVIIAGDVDTARTLAQHASQSVLTSLGGNHSAPSRQKPRASRTRSAGGGCGSRGHSERAPTVKARTHKAEATRKTAPVSPKVVSLSPTVEVIAPDGDAAALAHLPLAALVWTDLEQDPDGVLRERMFAAIGSLGMLGVRDVGRLVSLPSEQVASRFGEAGELLIRRARADHGRPLRRFVPSDRLAEEHELEALLEDLEPLTFILHGLFSRLEARLDARGLAVKSVQLTFLVEPGISNIIRAEDARRASSKRTETVELVFARPTRRAKTMLSLARERLGGALPGAIRAVTVEAISPTADRGAQLDLFTSYARKVEEVGDLVSRLQAVLGPHAVFSPQLADTHRPEAAWRPAPFDIERALRELPAPKPEKPSLPDVDAAAITATEARTRDALPEVNEQLGVTTIPDLIDTTELDRSTPWPKAIKRKPEDEPLPPLPPRPLELLQTPERATLLRASDAVVEAGELNWRGQRHHLVGVTGRERLEAEWWTPSPIARDYVIAETADGRRMWMFYEPNGSLFVHGIFD